MNSLNKDLEYKEEPRRSLLVAGVKECFKCLGWTQVLHLRQIEVLWAPQMAHFLWSWACPDAISTSLRILVIVSAVIWPSVNKTIACINSGGDHKTIVLMFILVSPRCSYSLTSTLFLSQLLQSSIVAAGEKMKCIPPALTSFIGPHLWMFPS